MLVGYGESEKLNATIITTKEEVDYQFWYPGRNKVIKDYKHIKGNYSWDDEVDLESENAKSTNSPRIYDLRTPLKKSRNTETFSDVTSDMLFDLSKDDISTHTRTFGRIRDSKPTTSTKLASTNTSKNSAVSLVDMILLEESSQDKHSKSGTVIKLKDYEQTLVVVVCL